MNFSIEDYHNKYGKSRQDVFFEYIQIKFDSKEIKYEYFAMLNCQDLLESLEFYIKERRITSRSTAGNYVNELGKFYLRLKEDYGITSEIFVNGSFLPEFFEMKDLLINQLNDQNDKSVAEEEKYESLNEMVEEFVHNLNYQQVIEGIDKYLSTKNKQAPKMFRKLCSSAALLIVLEYGCKSYVAVGLKIDSVSTDKETIYINGYQLPISNVLKDTMVMYIKARQYVLDKHNMKNEYLFINPNGKSFHNGVSRPDYSNFFYILKEKIKSVETELFAKRRLVQMMHYGLDLKVISKMSGFGDPTCEKLFDMFGDKEKEQKKLSLFITNSSNENMKIEKKGYINCPICGRSIKAIADTLILVKRNNDNTLYLACRNCGGVYGK